MRVRAYVAVTVAALIAGLAQIGSADAVVSPSVATVQAEQMTRPTGASIVNDVAASDGHAVKMTQTNTSLTENVSLPSSVTSLSLIARGTKYKGGWPQMSMKVDGRTVIPVTTVAHSGWHTFSANVALAPGTHTLSITYAYSRTRGRYLYADVINFFGPTTPVPVPTTTTPAPVPAATISSSYFGEHILGCLLYTSD